MAKHRKRNKRINKNKRNNFISENEIKEVFVGDGEGQPKETKNTLIKESSSLTTNNSVTYNNLSELFDRVSNHWKDILHCSKVLNEETLNILSVEDKNEQTHNFVERYKKLEGAVKAIEERCQKPELTLAMTGTTSSGKSTLVNLLVGDDIMPSAVEEMSAGIVRIVHSKEKRLVIKDTKGATWETGEWPNKNEPVLDADSLRERLYQTMHKFRDAEDIAEKNGGKVEEAVSFEVHWPTYIGNHPVEFGLPENVKVTLLDLPGLKSIDDERNGPIIRSNIQNALSLVVYNAAETDEEQKKTLLRDVVEQVKKLGAQGASPARMLFVLNRIDELLKNKEKAEESKKRLIENITSQLQGLLIEGWSEKTSEIREIRPITLSSRPAFLARKLISRTLSKEEKSKIVTELFHHFNAMIDDMSLWMPVMASINDLGSEEIKQLLDAYLDKSNFMKFQKTLSTHIADNLPNLLLAKVISDAEAALLGSTKDSKKKDNLSVLGAIDIILDASKAKNKAELDNLRAKLKAFLAKIQIKQEKILNILMDIAKTPTGTKLGDLAVRLSNEVNKEGLLEPLAYADEAVVRNPSDDITEFANSVLKGEEIAPPESGVFSYAEEKDRRNFYNYLDNLKETPYRRGCFEEVFIANKDGAERVAKDIEHFIDSYEDICRKIFTELAKDYGKRIEYILKDYIQYLINDLEKNIKNNDEAKNFKSIANVLSGMRLETLPFDVPDFRFTNQIEKVEEETHQRKIKRGFFKKLFQRDFSKYDYQTVVDQEEGLKFPSLDDLMEHCLSESSIVNKMSDALFVYIKRIVSSVRQDLSSRFNFLEKEYNISFDKREKELENNFNLNQEKIESVEEMTNDLRNMNNKKFF